MCISSVVSERCSFLRVIYHLFLFIICFIDFFLLFVILHENVPNWQIYLSAWPSVGWTDLEELGVVAWLEWIILLEELCQRVLALRLQKATSDPISPTLLAYKSPVNSQPPCLLACLPPCHHGPCHDDHGLSFRKCKQAPN